MSKKSVALIKSSPRPQVPRKKFYNFYLVFSIFAVLLFLTLPVAADRGINDFDFAMNLLLIPVNSRGSFFPITLVAIIMIETFGIMQLESLSFLKAVLLVIFVNFCLGFFDFLILGMLHSLSLLISLFPIYAKIGIQKITASIINALIIGRLADTFQFLSLIFLWIIPGIMYQSFMPRRGYFRQLNSKVYTFLVYFLFAVLGIVMLFLIASVDANKNVIILYIITASLILIGFIYHFIIKGFLYTLICKPKSPTLALSVFSMQVATLPVILASYYWIYH